jgi:hypothetical protein
MRQSQLITTFGPGAMIDLPNNGALIGGLEGWSPGAPVYEDRLVAKIEAALGIAGLKLFAPPIDTEDPTAAPLSGVTAWEFPEWFVAQYEDSSRERQGYRSRPLVHARGLTKGKYFGHDKKRHAVVPVRFVQACLNGHLSDIDWLAFVHGASAACGRAQLWLDERGTSGELADVIARCECGKGRSLVDAANRDEPVLGYCRGQRLWLGKGASERCGGDAGKSQWNRLLIRSASNAYFPQILSVISIPDPDSALRAAVDRVYETYLRDAESLDDVKRERRRERVHNAIEGLSDDLVWGEVRRRKQGLAPPDKSVKQAELEMLLASQDEIGEDAPDGIFHARSVAISAQSQFAPLLARLVRVDRLREVTAQVGFTRFEATSPDPQGELNLEVRRAPLALEPSWLPAVENRGEGVFLAFRREAIETWLARDAVKQRTAEFQRGFDSWRKNHAAPRSLFPGMPYVLLHTLSHLLIQAVSLECGYSASSIRERVYALAGGYGILLHTGTPDAEGTLGGLVQVARRIEHHLSKALELGRLCANDPICAHHPPDRILEERFLQGAACHGCAMIAEPSCERRNEYLDRSLVVPTVDSQNCAFFAGTST